MPVVLDVLSPWPVVSSLVCYIDVEDLLNLARSSSNCRAILHGFPLPDIPDGLGSPSSKPGDDGPTGSVRKDLYIGEHQTPQWKALKRFARLKCMEPNHKKGATPKPCRYCSMPVCEACIVKESFSQRKPLFKTRTRCLCAECWAAGHPLSCRRFTRKIPHGLTSDNSGGEFCTCMAKDGWICSKCRDIQCVVTDQSDLKCFGEGCSDPLAQTIGRRRICLWCGMPLCGQTMANRWGSYGQRQTVSGSYGQTQTVSGFLNSRPPSRRDDDLVLESADEDGAEMPPEATEPQDVHFRAIPTIDDGNE